jgi:hypothetical protein
MALEIKHVQNAKFGFYARPGNLKQLLILRRSVTQPTTEQRVFFCFKRCEINQPNYMLDETKLKF